MTFVLLINIKMPTIIHLGILTCISSISTASECFKARNNFFSAFKFLRVVEISCLVGLSIKNFITWRPGLEVIKLEFILRLKIKCNDWLLADMCPQAANHCALFEFHVTDKLWENVCGWRMSNH